LGTKHEAGGKRTKTEEETEEEENFRQWKIVLEIEDLAEADMAKREIYIRGA
jgi:hypothetical protein